MIRYRTLVEVLLDKSTNGGITFVEGSDQEDYLSYADLYTQATGVLFLLQERGVRQGEELVIQCSSNKDFVLVFWACILGGIIPIPLALGRTEDHRTKLFNILRLLQNPHLMISFEHFEKYKSYSLLAFLEEKNILFEEEILRNIPVNISGKIRHPREDDLAYVQFSSGSTGNPKGVKLTHKNLLSNAYAILKGIHSPEGGDLFFSWMPLSHDMGLIGYHITPLVAGWHHYLMPTELFIRRPSLWLQKITAHKITFTASPNFGYRYLLNRIENNTLENIDLSSVRIITNGAEPISAELCEEFVDKLASYGLKRNVIFPVYGLAEASLAVTFSEPESEIKTLKLDRAFLKAGNRIRMVSEQEDGIRFVNVGKPILQCNVRIVTEGRGLPEEVIGSIEIKGSNVTSGYYQNETATREVITGDGWLKTGDLGFIHEGDLFITGREKDILFVHGQNFYPHDIEKCLEETEDLELGKVAVGGCFNEAEKKEGVIAFVLYKDKIEKFVALSYRIRSRINQVFGFELAAVIPVREIPKTTSGKLQRYRLAEQYRQGKFKEIEKELTILAEGSEAERKRVLPQTDIEKKLYSIWNKVLGSKYFGVKDNFFELGGDSLKSAQVLSRIQEELDVEIPLGLFFEKPTIQELALEIEAQRKTTFLPIKKVEIPSVPLSASQRRIYYWWELHKESTAYNIPVAFRIDGDLDNRLLEQGLKKIIERHESLRTIIEKEKGEPVQKVHPTVEFELRNTIIAEQGIKEELGRRVLPFDLTKWPLFRIELLELTGSKHLLFLDFHHILFDGYSLQQFLHELLRCYHGEALPAVEVQWKDAVMWKKEDHPSERHRMQERFWVKQFEEEVPVLSLATDYTRPAFSSYQGEKLEFELSKEITHQMKQLSREKNVSLFMLFLASYQVLLSKYTGQEDLIVGVPATGRTHPHLQSTLGMYVNNLAIRSYPKGEKPFEVFLSEIKEVTIKALDNQDYPFDELVDKIDLQRDSSRNLLFDTMFIFQNFEMPHVQNQRIDVKRCSFDPGISKYDLSIELFDEGETITYYLEYSTELFDRETIHRFSSHYQHLLEQVVKFPKTKLSDISILSHTEYQNHIADFNQTRRECPGVPIHELIDAQAAQNPKGIALIDGDEAWTYEQLHSRANQLAGYLVRNGITSNTPVVIYMNRSAHLVVGILAILKAGGCYIPIDIDQPEERIHYIIEESHAKLIITEGRQKEDLHGFKNEIICIDDPQIYESTTALSHFGSLRDIAYVIYTSGTTGNPKGVMIDHTSLVNYITWAVHTYVKEEKLSFPLYTSVSFDLTVTSIFVPLVSGGTIRVYRDDEKYLSIEKVIEDNQADIIKLTPSHLKMVNSHTSLKRRIKESKIRKFIVGGEDLPTQVAQEAWKLFGGHVEIFNEYGPTEATVGCMIYKYNPGKDKRPSVPIGIPIWNTQIYLLDHYLKPVPEGVLGELYISGDGLAGGYLFRPELTEEKFIPHPFIKGKRMYKTGDLARRLPEGNIEFIGRKDHQVKIKGHRIELSEIETQLLKYEEITQGVVIEKQDQRGEKYLCAYYVSIRRSMKMDVSKLRSFMASSLPSYMIPSYFIPLDEMPLTKHGKVNYKALPEQDKSQERESVIGPRNEIEALSLEIWQDVLNTKTISIDTNFYELGGDSIKAVQIASRLFDKGISVNAKDILTYQTIEQIGVYAKVTDEKNRYEQGLITGEVELNPIQRWFFDQNFTNANYYNQSVLLEFKEEIDIALLEKTFEKLIEHHDGLRLNYRPDTHTLLYNNDLLNRQFIIEEVDLTEEEEHLRNKKFIAIGAKLKGSIDITGGLLIKVIVIKDSSFKVLITAHHLVVDGMSWRVLLEDMKKIYTSLKKKEDIALPPKTASLKDWYHELMEFSKKEILQNEIAYWQEIENTDFELPKDFHSEELTNTDVRQIRGLLDEEQTAYLLKEAHQVYHTDVLTLLVVALVRTIHEWTRKEKIVIELENHGRHLDDIDVSRTIGWFTAMYPVKFTIDQDNLHDQIKSIKEQIRKVPDHGLGYGILKYITKAVKSKKGISEIRFNYLGQFDREIDNDLFIYTIANTGSEIDPDNSLTSQVEINCMIMKGQLQVEINYNSNVFKRETVERFSKSYLSHLEYILNHVRNENDVYFTPSDFDAVDLDEEDLKILFGR